MEPITFNTLQHGLIAMGTVIVAAAVVVARLIGRRGMEASLSLTKIVKRPLDAQLADLDKRT